MPENQYSCMRETKWDCDDCFFPTICGLFKLRWVIIITEEHDEKK